MFQQGGRMRTDEGEAGVEEPDDVLHLLERGLAVDAALAPPRGAKDERGDHRHADARHRVRREAPACMGGKMCWLRMHMGGRAELLGQAP